MGATLGLLWAYFGISLGSLWVSVGEFGSLDGYFAMIVESLWVYEAPFSNKNTPGHGTTDDVRGFSMPWLQSPANSLL